MKSFRNSERTAVFTAVFFLINLIGIQLLTSSVLMETMSPFPKTFSMVANSISGDFGFLLFILGIAFLIFKKDYSRNRFLMAASLFFAFVYFLLSIYFSYYGMFFSFTNLDAFSVSAGGEAFLFIIDSMLLLLSYGKYIYIVFAILVVCIYIWLFGHHKKNQAIRNHSMFSNRFRYYFGPSLMVFGLLLMGISLQVYQTKIKNTYFEDNSNPLYGTETAGFFSYYMLDFVYYISDEEKIVDPQNIMEVESKLENYTSPLQISSIDQTVYGNNNSLYGKFRNKNLLVIQVESLNNFVIGLTVELDGRSYEVTPNLNRLANESVYFTNFYSNVGIGNTSDAEFSLMTGLYPDGSNYSVYEYDNVQYETLPKLFRDKGYYTFSVHANDGNFYERNKIFPELYGFHDHYAKEQLKTESEYILHTWLNDESMLKQTIDIMKTKSAFQNTFGFAITISNHVPYEKPQNSTKDCWFEGKSNLLPKGVMLAKNRSINEQVIGYLEHASYTDYAIGNALQYLKDTGLAENTVVVIYGDHGCGINFFDSFYEFPEKYKNTINPILTETPFDKTNSFLQRQMMANVPLFIYDSSGLLEPMINKNARGISSLSRTLANLLALDSRYYFGIDALSEAKTLVYNPRNLDIFANGIIISGQSGEFVITDPEFKSFYTEDRVQTIISGLYKYKDFNDKLLRYEVFPKLE